MMWRTCLVDAWLVLAVTKKLFNIQNGFFWAIDKFEHEPIGKIAYCQYKRYR